MKRKINIRGFAVMKVACVTCPFTTQSLGVEATAPYLESLVCLQAQHTCHSVNDTKICRGGRDLMLKVMKVKGLIDEATDESFEAASKAALGKRYVEPGTKP